MELNSNSINRMVEMNVGPYSVPSSKEILGIKTHECEINDHDDMNVELWKTFVNQERTGGKKKSPPTLMAMPSLYPSCNIINNNAVTSGVPVHSFSCRDFPLELSYTATRNSDFKKFYRFHIISISDLLEPTHSIRISDCDVVFIGNMYTYAMFRLLITCSKCNKNGYFVLVFEEHFPSKIKIGVFRVAQLGLIKDKHWIKIIKPPIRGDFNEYYVSKAHFLLQE